MCKAALQALETRSHQKRNPSEGLVHFLKHLIGPTFYRAINQMRLVPKSWNLLLVTVGYSQHTTPLRMTALTADLDQSEYGPANHLALSRLHPTAPHPAGSMPSHDSRAPEMCHPDTGSRDLDCYICPGHGVLDDGFSSCDKHACIHTIFVQKTNSITVEHTGRMSQGHGRCR